MGEKLGMGPGLTEGRGKPPVGAGTPPGKPPEGTGKLGKGPVGNDPPGALGTGGREPLGRAGACGAAATRLLESK